MIELWVGGTASYSRHRKASVALRTYTRLCRVYGVALVGCSIPIYELGELADRELGEWDVGVALEADEAK